MLLSIGTWLLLSAFSLIVFLWLRGTLRPMWRIVEPMWLPVAVMVAAGVVLFFTDQGLELGVSVVGGSWQQFVLLGLALLYWAVGTWQAGRLGLNRVFGADKRQWPAAYRSWLRWSPRLLGACAHLLASLSVAFGARLLVDPGVEVRSGVKLWWLVFLPPLTIASVTLALWMAERSMLPKESGPVAPTPDPHAPARAAPAPAWLDRCFAWIEARPGRAYAWLCNVVARRLPRLPALPAGLSGAFQVVTIVMAIVPGLGTIILLFALGNDVPAALAWAVGSGRECSASRGDCLPAGLAWATLSIFLSALAFLLIVMFRTRLVALLRVDESRARPALTRLQTLFTSSSYADAIASAIIAGALVVVASLVGYAAWADAISLGWSAGAVVIAFFAFGSYVAVIDTARALTGSGRAFAALCGALLVFAAFVAGNRDFHRVRRCGDPLTQCVATDAWSDPRPTVEEAARAWHKQAAASYPAGVPVPMLIVATAGGGIRAAHWTATVLERLEVDLGADVVRRHLFAISAVSGGSVGGSAYAASLAGGPKPTTMLAHDFLAPALAAMAFVDGPSSFLWEHGTGDRGWALERSWEIASKDVLAKPFLSLAGNAAELAADSSGWRPMLLLNATHQATGRRVITSHLKVDSYVFLDSFDLHDLLKVDLPASTAAHNSARFTYVSPAGKLVPKAAAESGSDESRGYILDGGYFENFGALTALQLAREVERVLGRQKVRPIIVQVSSDPSLWKRDRARVRNDGPPCAVDPKAPFNPYTAGEWLGTRWQERDGRQNGIARYFNQLTAPFAGVLSSREAHGTLASMELARWACEPASLSDASGVATAVQSGHDLQHQVAALGTPPLGDKSELLSAPIPARHFVHFAMCDGATDTVPPLGWVLSESMRNKFADILVKQCDNSKELEMLKQLLG